MVAYQVAVVCRSEVSIKNSDRSSLRKKFNIEISKDSEFSQSLDFIHQHYTNSKSKKSHTKTLKKLQTSCSKVVTSTNLLQPNKNIQNTAHQLQTGKGSKKLKFDYSSDGYQSNGSLDLENTR
jgi:hypothetical protein